MPPEAPLARSDALQRKREDRVATLTPNRPQHPDPSEGGRAVGEKRAPSWAPCVGD